MITNFEAELEKVNPTKGGGTNEGKKEFIAEYDPHTLKILKVYENIHNVEYDGQNGGYAYNWFADDEIAVYMGMRKFLEDPAMEFAHKVPFGLEKVV